jgi:hypothetical protein
MHRFTLESLWNLGCAREGNLGRQSQTERDAGGDQRNAYFFTVSIIRTGTAEHYGPTDKRKYL